MPIFKSRRKRPKHVSKQLRVQDGILNLDAWYYGASTLRRAVVTRCNKQAYCGVENATAVISTRHYWPSMYAYISVIYLTVLYVKEQNVTVYTTGTTFAIVHTRYPMQFVLIDMAT